MEETVITYAQNREDLILAGFFGAHETGFYVDVGAYHPTDSSVTQYFYERGWRGINIEPNKAMFDRLASERTRDTNLNLGIAEKPGELRLRVYKGGEGLSTFSDSIKAKHAAKPSITTEQYHEVTVPVVTLAQIFKEQQVKHINFLKIDVEGYEYNVIAGNDWKVYRPDVICIEANHIVQDWRPLLASADYRQIFYDGLNEYYVAKEAAHRAKQFSYVQAIFGRTVITPDWQEEKKQLAVLTRNTANQQLQIQALHKLNTKLERQVEIFHSQLHEQLRFKNLVKNLVLKIDSIILRHLSKMTKKPHYYPSLHVPSNAADDPKKLLAIVGTADAKSFAGAPGLGWQLMTAVGTGVFLSYFWSRRLLFRLFKPVWKLIRRPKTA